MGQKVHPIGFRIGITKEHNSKWYAKFSDYAKLIKADTELREKFNIPVNKIVIGMIAHIVVVL